LAGYEDVNDAERLAVDPAMRHVVGGRASQPEKQAASTSEVGRFETKILRTKANIKKLMDLSGEWIDTGCQTLVAHDAAGEAGENRGEGRAAREVRDVSTGRGSRPSSTLS